MRLEITTRNIIGALLMTAVVATALRRCLRRYAPAVVAPWPKAMTVL